MLNGNVDINRYRKTSLSDDKRRFDFLKDAITNKNILDFGCGAGGFLHLATKVCSSVTGIEPDNTLRKILNHEEISCYHDINEVDDKFDFITLFHVLEHLTDPIKVLRSLVSKLNHNGKLIVKVPSSDDALLTLFKSREFSEFTYWSCHLFLYNPNTLKMIANKANYNVEYIKQIQRYPLSNHLHWLSNGTSGGHQIWNFLDSNELHLQYEKQLASIGKCDTLLMCISPK
ncbi:class I SAM-dependent methyltransferase [Heyndrickxia ginsengihumi]|uniref:class I SAM-dependent methyltransferase n=1 Tax=Heyndrickxia ginsengihumi TaxID=363870 RepID=UPI003D262B5B